MDDNCDPSGSMAVGIHRVYRRRLDPSAAGYRTDHNSDTAAYWTTHLRAR